MTKAKKEYTLKDDVIFKVFFSRKGNEIFLIDFLNALLKIDIHTIKIKEEVNLLQLSKEEKGGRIDLQAELNNGIIVNIEMQMKNEGNIIERTETYSSKVKTQNTIRGTDYKGMKKVIMINILNYVIFPQYKEFVLDTSLVLKQHKELEISNNTQYYFIELPKFRKQNPDMENKLNQWLAIIDATDKERMKMAIANNKVLERAQTEITYLTGDAAARRLAELREKWEMDRISALNYAEEKGERRGLIRGEKRGKKQAKKKIAKIMLKKNIKINEIIEITGLTKEEIERLKMN